MNLIGFSIAADFISLTTDRGSVDLHNDYAFGGIIYRPAERVARLEWTRRTNEWVRSQGPREIWLEFRKVFLLKVQERDVSLPFTEDDCLSTIGFLWNDLLSEMRGFTTNTPSDDCCHLVASFMSGFSVKIGAESTVAVFGADP
jgi:hypothetical protein